MTEVKSDIQIAREAKMHPIKDILSKIGVPDENFAFSPMGRHIAKINLEYLDTLKNENGKLILVTAITPTPAGEGKTTTSVGLNDGLNKIGKKSIVCLREPSLDLLWNEGWSCWWWLCASSTNGTNQSSFYWRLSCYYICPQFIIRFNR